MTSEALFLWNTLQILARTGFAFRHGHDQEQLWRVTGKLFWSEVGFEEIVLFSSKQPLIRLLRFWRLPLARIPGTENCFDHGHVFDCILK